MENCIVLVRHAATQGGAGRAIGRTPLPLSDEGKRQAQELIQQLAHIPFAAIYSSPATRAMETVKPLCTQTGLHVQSVPELNEIALGDWDGRTFDELKSRFPDAYAERGRNLALFRPPDGTSAGESFTDVDVRVHNALMRIAAGPLPALVVTHAGCIRTVLCRCHGTPLNDLFRHTPRNAQPHVIRLENGRFRLMPHGIL